MIIPGINLDIGRNMSISATINEIPCIL